MTRRPIDDPWERTRRRETLMELAPTVRQHRCPLGLDEELARLERLHPIVTRVQAR